MRRAVLVLAVSGLLLTACGVDSQSPPSTVPKVNYDHIVHKFSHKLPAALEAVDPKITIPDDPMHVRLSHADPLDLPIANFSISGSDTVSPVTAVVIENFHDEGYPGQFRMNQSSTGTGMKAMCRGEGIDLVNASRMMKSKERKICDEMGIVPVTVKIGYDPFVLITHADNNWMKNVRRGQLRNLFRSNNWSQVDPNFPDRPISFYLPRVGGGSFNAMTEFVYGDADAPYIAEVENGHFYPYNLELTRDLAEDPNGIGFASFGKLAKLKQLKANVIPVDGARPVTSGGAYPIKRSLYVVTNTEALKKPEVQAFIAYYLNVSREAMPPLGFAPLEGRDALNERQKFIAELDNLFGEEHVIKIIEK